MKKTFLFIAALFCFQSAANAADLLEIYQQALTSDPTYLQAVSQRMADREGLPINLANLFPNVAVTANPSVVRQGNSGAIVRGGITALSPRNVTQRQYTLNLTLTQTVFNYAQFSQVAGAYAAAKGADATLNAALQSLMVRVAKAYFAVLQDEDNLKYSEASKLAFAEQLDQVKQQYDVGLKTITDVYTAQAAYDSAVSDYISAETNLANDRENLRVIAGKYYPSIASLSEEFPLVTPQPANVEQWVKVSQLQNWLVKQRQYAVESARQNIHTQFAGHLPTVNVQGIASKQYTNNINPYNDPLSLDRNGASTVSDRTIQVNINVPIFAGGQVTAQTSQATYQYEVSQQQLEFELRNTINATRQSYLNVISGVSKLTADKQAIKSNISSLQGMEESYKVGTETLVNVLNQQKILFQAQTQYATDRYAFVNNVLALKQAAGTLSFDDLRAINAWLLEGHQTGERIAYFHPKKTHPKVKHSTSSKKKSAGMSAQNGMIKHKLATHSIKTTRMALYKKSSNNVTKA